MRQPRTPLYCCTAHLHFLHHLRLPPPSFHRHKQTDISLLACCRILVSGCSHDGLVWNYRSLVNHLLLLGYGFLLRFHYRMLSLRRSARLFPYVMMVFGSFDYFPFVLTSFRSFLCYVSCTTPDVTFRVAFWVPLPGSSYNHSRLYHIPQRALCVCRILAETNIDEGRGADVILLMDGFGDDGSGNRRTGSTAWHDLLRTLSHRLVLRVATRHSALTPRACLSSPSPLHASLFPRLSFSAATHFSLLRTTAAHCAHHIGGHG